MGCFESKEEAPVDWGEKLPTPPPEPTREEETEQEYVTRVKVKKPKNDDEFGVPDSHGPDRQDSEGEDYDENRAMLAKVPSVKDKLAAFENSAASAEDKTESFREKIEIKRAISIKDQMKSYEELDQKANEKPEKLAQLEIKKSASLLAQMKEYEERDKNADKLPEKEDVVVSTSKLTKMTSDFESGQVDMRAEFEKMMRSTSSKKSYRKL